MHLISSTCHASHCIIDARSVYLYICVCVRGAACMHAVMDIWCLPWEEACKHGLEQKRGRFEVKEVKCGEEAMLLWPCWHNCFFMTKNFSFMYVHFPNIRYRVFSSGVQKESKRLVYSCELVHACMIIQCVLQLIE